MIGQMIRRNLWIALACCLVGCGRETISLEQALFDVPGSNESVGESETLSEEISISEKQVQESKLYVYVCGAVVSPGVYPLEEDARIVSAIEAAGGFLEGASAESINLAQKVTDGMQITVPTMEEVLILDKQQVAKSQGMVNINKASVEELCALRGIGKSKAEAIIVYREEKGPFKDIKELTEVNGIGENLFEQIKEKVYIE